MFVCCLFQTDAKEGVTNCLGKYEIWGAETIIENSN